MSDDSWVQAVVDAWHGAGDEKPTSVVFPNGERINLEGATYVGQWHGRLVIERGALKSSA